MKILKYFIKILKDILYEENQLVVKYYIDVIIYYFFVIIIIPYSYIQHS